jgi:hypothetical protein
VDDDPVTEVKKVEGYVSVPVFVCRYKLVGSSRSAKIEPYLDFDENELNKSGLKSAFQVSSRVALSGNSVAKGNKSNLPPSSKVDGIIKLHLKSQKNGFTSDAKTEDNVLEANRENWRKKCDRKSHELKSDLTPVKRMNTHRSFKNDFDPPLEPCYSNQIKTNTGDSLLLRKSYVLLEKLNLEMDSQKESVEDGNRSSSPTIPFTGTGSLFFCISCLLVKQRLGFLTY